jgi:RNA polymerase primary sigma factor
MDLPVKRVRIIRRAVRALQSPQTVARDRDGDLIQLSDIVADSRNGMPDENAFRGDELETLRRLMETIDEREARVLRLRFGLDGTEPLTLKQIADDIGVSRERIRQIVDEALTKLNARFTDARPSQFFRQDDEVSEAYDADEVESER